MSDFSSLTKSIELKDQQIKALEHTVNDLKARLDASEIELRDQLEGRRRLSQEISEWQDHVNQLEERIKNLESVAMYPFSEGETYYTLEPCEKDGITVVRSVWDDTSEQLYSRNRLYFAGLDIANEHLESIRKYSASLDGWTTRIYK